jgi:hypothetical protein
VKPVPRPRDRLSLLAQRFGGTESTLRGPRQRALDSPQGPRMTLPVDRAFEATCQRVGAAAVGLRVGTPGGALRA